VCFSISLAIIHSREGGGDFDSKEKTFSSLPFDQKDHFDFGSTPYPTMTAIMVIKKKRVHGSGKISL